MRNESMKTEIIPTTVLLMIYSTVYFFFCSPNYTTEDQWPTVGMDRTYKLYIFSQVNPAMLLCTEFYAEFITIYSDISIG